MGKGNVKAERQCVAAGDRILELLVIGQLIRKHQIPKLWWLLFIQWCPTFCNPMDCGTPGFPVLHYLPEFAQTHVHWVDDAIQSSHPLIPFSSCLQSFPASGSFPVNWLFTSGGQSIGASALAISPSNEYSWLISFRIDWFDLLAVQGTLKSLPQPHSSKASILQCLAFFMIQLSHLYMTTGKITALNTQTFVGKVMSLLFNTPSMFFMAFLPRSRCLLI